jgi:putative membrane protein
MAGVFWLVDRLLTSITVIGNPDAPLGTVGTYLWIALIFAVVNAVIGPIVRLLSLPFVVLTLGLFLLVINAALLGLTALLTDRLEVDGFVAAVVGGLLLAIGGWAADQVVERV